MSILRIITKKKGFFFTPDRYRYLFFVAQNSRCATKGSRCVVKDYRCVVMGSHLVVMVSRCVVMDSRCAVVNSRCVWWVFIVFRLIFVVLR